MNIEEFKEAQQRSETPVSKLLAKAAQDKKAMKLHPKSFPGDTRWGDSTIITAGDERRDIISENVKNTYNRNNNVFNIYDENGSLYATTDAELIDKIVSAHKELKLDGNLGVALSNGESLASPDRNQEWQEISQLGMHRSNHYYQRKNEKEDAKAESLAQRLAQLRGTSKEAPKAVKKTEMNPNMAFARMSGKSM